MNISRSLQSTKKYIPALLSLTSLIIFFCMPELTSRGCADGIELCLNTAVPSLFPMMLATVLATEIGLTEQIGRILSSPFEKLFGLSRAAGGAVVMALVGGYPSGAKAVCGLYQRGVVSADEARHMIMLCFAGGPAFLVGAVGGMYRSSRLGVVLLIIQIISVLIMGLFMRHFTKKTNCGICGCNNDVRGESMTFTQALTKSLTATSGTMLNICLYIVFFSIIGAVLDGSGASAVIAGWLMKVGLGEQTAEAVLPVLLEVTSGCLAASRAGFVMTAFAVGFGGMAVHMQVLAIARNLKVKYLSFLGARLIQGALCALMAWGYLLMAPQEVAAASASPAGTAAISSTPTGAVLLVVMCVMWIICLPSGGTIKKAQA